MTAVPTSRPGRPYVRRSSAPRAVCLLGSLVLLLAAALGTTLWNQVPDFPPPAANEELLALRRMLTAVLGLLGLLSLPWVLRPALLPLVGLGVHVVASLASVGAVVALRGESVASLLWIPVPTSAAASLAIVWTAARPVPGRL